MVVLVGEAPGLQRMITAFTDQAPAVAHAAVSSGGLALAFSRDLPQDFADQLAAITSGLCSLMHGAARIFEGGRVIQTVVVMDRGLLIVKAITGEAVLTVLAAADCDIDQVIYEMELLGERARHALGPTMPAP